MSKPKNNKSNPSLKNPPPKDNERYWDNSYTSNGYSFITNKNLLNTSMSPIQRVALKTNNTKDSQLVISQKLSSHQLQPQDNSQIQNAQNNLQNLGQEEDDEIAEDLTLTNDEMLGQISRVQEYSYSPTNRNPKIPGEVSYIKPVENDHSMITGDRFFSPEQKDHNDDSAINPCNDYSQNMGDKSELHTLMYDSGVITSKL